MNVLCIVYKLFVILNEYIINMLIMFRFLEHPVKIIIIIKKEKLTISGSLALPRFYKDTQKYTTYRNVVGNMLNAENGKYRFDYCLSCLFWTIGEFHSILLHRTTLGGQLCTYCHFVPCRNEQLWPNCIYVLPEGQYL